jgi:hypothetical protein
MATAHGAGLMLLPLFVEGGAVVPSCHAHVAAVASSGATYVAATLVHTLAMLLVAGVTAALVYSHFGLSLLRRAWFNVDRVWAGALVVSGIAAIAL